MRAYSRTVLAIAFGALLTVLLIFSFNAIRKVKRLHSETQQINTESRRADELLTGIRSDLYLTSIFVRDYLLDPSHLTGPLYRQKLEELRDSVGAKLTDIDKLLEPDERSRLRQLNQELNSYMSSMDPLFEWTPRKKAALGSLFLQKQVVPRRNAIMMMASQISELKDQRFLRREARIQQGQSQLSDYLKRMALVCFLLGLLVAVLSMLRISHLERRSEEQHQRTLKAEHELRLLSQQLVRGQEEERKSISRDLHDEVGQLLTAVRIELGALEKSRSNGTEEFQTHLREVRTLTEDAIRSIRDLAMGLRPSMLDELGLEPALEWQARDFARRTGLNVSIEIDGAMNKLPDTHRTCVYRVVQESLTNCARHSAARNIRITLHGTAERVVLTVQDDGEGFDPDEPSVRGLGLLGIEERVRDLGGNVSIISQKSTGTLVRAEIPFSREAQSLT